jgi:hypothetical protein
MTKEVCKPLSTEEDYAAAIAVINKRYGDKGFDTGSISKFLAKESAD